MLTTITALEEDRLEPPICASWFYFILKNKLLPRLPLSLCFLLGMVSIAVGIMRFRGEYATVKILRAHRAHDWQAMVLWVDAAENPLYHFDPMTTPLQWYSGVGYAGMGDYAAAQLAFAAAYQRHQYHIHVLNNLAGVYHLQGNTQQAIVFYQAALRISPNFEQARNNLSIVKNNE